MDLKSLKERKSMLQESASVETVLQKTPFEINVENLSPESKNNIDKLGSICKILKPHSIGPCTDVSICATNLDAECRKLAKTQQLETLRAEIQDVKNKINRFPALLRDSQILAEELQMKNSSLEVVADQGQDQLSDPDPTPEDEAALTHSKVFEQLVQDFDEMQKLHCDTSCYKQRLKSIPIKPGFDFSKENLQSLLADRLMLLEELKRQVFEDSMVE